MESSLDHGLHAVTVNDPSCIAFLQWALPRMGMRWPGFRKVRRQVCRRIQGRVEELGLRGPEDYRIYLGAHPAEWDHLAVLCRVTISRFARDREVWRVLEEEVLPVLTQQPLHREPSGSHRRAPSSEPPAGEAVLRAWSAGCASGEEPYTLSIVWRGGPGRAFPGVELRVLATDLDPIVLDRARRGRYPESTLHDMDPAVVDRAFRREDGEFVLEEEYRRGIEFVQSDIRREMPDGLFNLVLCRNLVFTYFDEATQASLLSALLERLAPGGVLVLGGHERLPAGEWPLQQWRAGVPVFRMAW